MNKLVAYSAILLCLGSVQAWAEDAKEDTPSDLAKRYVDASNNKDKEAIKKLWVTPKLLTLFLEKVPAKDFGVPKEKHADYVAESMKQQEKRLARWIAELEQPLPRSEVLEVTVDQPEFSGLGFRRLKLKRRETATNKVHVGFIVQEGIKINGRWYFYEKP